MPLLYAKRATLLAMTLRTGRKRGYFVVAAEVSALAEPWSRPKLGPRRRLGLNPRQRLRRRSWRQRLNFFRQRLAFNQQLQLGGVQHFPIEQSDSDALES